MSSDHVQRLAAGWQQAFRVQQKPASAAAAYTSKTLTAAHRGASSLPRVHHLLAADSSHLLVLRRSLNALSKCQYPSQFPEGNALMLNATIWTRAAGLPCSPLRSRRREQTTAGCPAQRSLSAGPPGSSRLTRDAATAVDPARGSCRLCCVPKPLKPFVSSVGKLTASVGSFGTTCQGG